MKLKNLIRLDRIDKNKNSKFTFYLNNILLLLTPSFFYRKELKELLKEKSSNTIMQRVNYYNKLSTTFEITQDFKTISKYILNEKKKTYFFDLLKYLKYFNHKLKISYLFGDITHIPENPSFVKSRPISEDNENSVLMKLNAVRHFIFVDDKKAFEEKKDMLVWRGKAYRDHRQEFLKEFHNHPLCNVGQTNTKGDLDVTWQKEKLSLEEQLEYKFILAIEGNDVASNLKWAMSSNSLVMMTKPKYETWFMEGLLKENFHYVLLKDDYSDLEEKILYYSEHIDEANKIIANAHEYIEQFKDEKSEKLISLLVLQKYFRLSHQL